jgi:hypothetical protein
MWLFLSSRLRRWLLLGIALPIGQKALRRARAASQQRRSSTPRLTQADSALAKPDARSRADVSSQLDHLPWRRRSSSTK